jgi:hypothetical protein
VGEFVELQGLSDDDRRARLQLPPSCSPRLGASPSITSPGRLNVQIDCDPGVVPATAIERWTPRVPEVSFGKEAKTD